MVTIMNTGSGKVLDEACNRYNDVYSDEVLYASWTESPRADVGLPAVAVPVAAPAAGVDIDAYLARLYASQGQQGRRR